MINLYTSQMYTRIPFNEVEESFSISLSKSSTKLFQV